MKAFISWFFADLGARRLTQQIGRFNSVGIVNTVLTFSIFTTLMKSFGVNYLGALLASWCCGMVLSYLLNFVWVFSQPDPFVFDHRFLKFAVTALLSITLNLLTLGYLVEMTNGDPFWLQIALIPPIAGFNFLAAKFWSLTRTGGRARKGSNR